MAGVVLTYQKRVFLMEYPFDITATCVRNHVESSNYRE